MLRTNSSRLCSSYQTLARAPKLLSSQAPCISPYYQQFQGVVGVPTSFFSTKAREEGIKCPFTQQSRDLSATVAEGAIPRDEAPTPTLKHVPSMPYLGSFFSLIPGIGKYLMSLNGISTLRKDNAYEFYPEMRRRFGDFYTIGIPGLGTGIKGTAYLLNDPDEMVKVLRQEGAYPRGGIESVAAFITWSKERGLSVSAGEDNGFFGRGETWRRLRTFMQTDLLSPQSAKGYVSGVAAAAEIASKGAPKHADDLNTYFNYCAFDMFNTIMFGELTKVSDPDSPIDPINLTFCHESVKSLGLLIAQIQDKMEVINAKRGIKTDMYREFAASMDIVYDIAYQKITNFKHLWELRQLNENQKASYLAHAFERQNVEGGNVSAEEMVDIAVLILNASVDTTSTFISWIVVHLALNPDVQQKLYKEVKRNVDEQGGKVCADMLTRAKSPYLHAVTRESQRLTPVHPTTMTKSNSAADIVVHGIKIPKGSVFVFDNFSVGVDPVIVPDPQTFDPERWLPEAVSARKGTRAEVLDHQFYKDPFSQGARRCPGSRVAVNETLVLLSQLVCDWKIEPPAEVTSLNDIKYELQTLLLPKIPKLTFTART